MKLRSNMTKISEIFYGTYDPKLWKEISKKCKKIAKYFHIH